MSWFGELMLQVEELGSWGLLLFAALYVIAAVMMAPAFLLAIAAGAMFGVWGGSALGFVSATLGAIATYIVAARFSETRLVAWMAQRPRVAAVRSAIAAAGVWVQFLLRLSPVVPYVLLNYGLGLSRVRFRDFLIALVGMIPTLVVFAYYGQVIGDVTKIAAGQRLPVGREYYMLLAIGIVATIVASVAIGRAARRAMDAADDAAA